MGEKPWKPTKEQLEAAVDKRLTDLIAPDLHVLFCGVNPGLYTAAINRHYGRPGNRFWRVLHLSGFTQRQLSPFEEHELLADGFGITNLVARPTRQSSELTREELVHGAEVLRGKLRKFRPRALAIIGMQAYRVGFERPKATVGLQPELIEDTPVWMLPCPSGLQANYLVPRQVELYSDMRKQVLQLVG